MTFAAPSVSDRPDSWPGLPSWLTRENAQAPEDAAFLAGAALSYLQLLLARNDVPHALFRSRLALRAAEACMRFAGRPERAAELRDAVAFLQPGDHPGPAGAVYLSWKRSVARPLSVKGLCDALPDMGAEQIAALLDGAEGPNAIARAGAVFDHVQAVRSRADEEAFLLADAALAQGFGWSYLVPLLAFGTRRGSFDRKDALWRAYHRAALVAIREVSELGRRAARLKEVAPKLRAKGAEAAVEMFLTHDAVAPTALSALRSDRAARRFCDRLVELGAGRELTGRDTFRLYGV